MGRRRLATLAVGLLAAAGIALPSSGAGAIAHGGPVAQVPTPSPEFRGEQLDKNDEVRAVDQAGRWVLVGGSYLAVEADGRRVEQGKLNAYDARTGRLHPTLRPQLNGTVRSVVPDGPDAFFAVGDFTEVDGSRRRGIARFDLVTGKLDRSFHAEPNAFVNDAVVVGDRVVIGGAFVSVAGEPRSRLAAVDRRTGALDPDVVFDLSEAHALDVAVRSLDLSPDGRHVLVAHTGRRVNEAYRTGLAIIDMAGTPRLRDWRVRTYEPACDATRAEFGFPWMREATFSPDGTWIAVIAANGNFPPGCDAVNRFPTTDLDDKDVPLVWSAALFDTPESVAISDGAVYVGGHFTSVMGPGTTIADYPRGNNVKTPEGSINRFQLAALSPVDGTGLREWRANANGVRGVLALQVTPDGLLAGSDGDSWGNVEIGPHARFTRVLLERSSAARGKRPKDLGPGLGNGDLDGS